MLPTAKQFVVVGHDTSASPVEGTLGLVTIDHVLPFQRSISVVVADVWAENVWMEPTAKHEVLVGHETESTAGTVVVVRVGPGTIDHAAPFQCSMNGSKGKKPLEKEPTAKQFFAVAHATPANSLPPDASDGRGLGTTDHAVPFQRSTSVCSPVPRTPPPTATQLAALVHATELSVIAVPGTLGLAAIDQAVPFQCSITGTPLNTPTAKQLAAPGHAISLSEPPGVATIDQCAPSHCSINDAYGPLPAAKHVVAVAQATAEKEPFSEPIPGLTLGTTDHEGTTDDAGVADAVIATPEHNIIATTTLNDLCIAHAPQNSSAFSPPTLAPIDPYDGRHDPHGQCRPSRIGPPYGLIRELSRFCHCVRTNCSS